MSVHRQHAPADAGLRESSDAELLAHALAEGRALVTNNVAEFERLRRHHGALGHPVPGLIYTSDPASPRDRQFIGRLITALDHARTSNAVTTTGGVLWLQPPRE